MGRSMTEQSNSILAAALPKVIATNKALTASANSGIAKVLANLDGLVYCTVTVAKISRLGVAEMDSKTFRRAAKQRKFTDKQSDAEYYNPIACAKLMTPLSVKTAGELRPEMTTCGTVLSLCRCQ